MTLIRERTSVSTSVSADWLNQRAKVLRRNGQHLTADKAEAKAHRLFMEAKDLRDKELGIK